MVRMLCNTYSSLHVRIRMVEVLQVLIAIDPGGHRRDIESEESTADGAESGERVDVRDLIHGGDGVEQCSCFSDLRDHKTKRKDNRSLEPRRRRLKQGRKKKDQHSTKYFPDHRYEFTRKDTIRYYCILVPPDPTSRPAANRRVRHSGGVEQAFASDQAIQTKRTHNSNSHLHSPVGKVATSWSSLHGGGVRPRESVICYWLAVKSRKVLAVVEGGARCGSAGECNLSGRRRHGPDSMHIDVTSGLVLVVHAIMEVISVQVSG